MVKNSPTMQETWVPFLGWEDPLEKSMATHSSILAWRIPRTEEPGRLQSMGCKELDMTERLSLHLGKGFRKTATKFKSLVPEKGKHPSLVTGLDNSLCNYFFCKLYPIISLKEWSVVLLKINEWSQV